MTKEHRHLDLQLIRSALASNDWKITVAAKSLGITVVTMRKKAVAFKLWPLKKNKP